MTNQGLECRTAVLSGNQAEAVKSPQHQAKIMRHPAWHHPRRLTLEGLKVIAAVANVLAQHGGPDRRYLCPGQCVGADELDVVRGNGWDARSRRSNSAAAASAMSRISTIVTPTPPIGIG
jgi:hypothetical protein